jgi:hypothetical protein
MREARCVAVLTEASKRIFNSQIGRVKLTLGCNSVREFLSAKHIVLLSGILISSSSLTLELHYVSEKRYSYI